eukprot:326711-Pelagomonas_calceolata.AAC.5
MDAQNAQGRSNQLSQPPLQVVMECQVTTAGGSGGGDDDDHGKGVPGDHLTFEPAPKLTGPRTITPAPRSTPWPMLGCRTPACAPQQQLDEVTERETMQQH